MDHLMLIDNDANGLHVDHDSNVPHVDARLLGWARPLHAAQHTHQVRRRATEDHVSTQSSLYVYTKPSHIQSRCRSLFLTLAPLGHSIIIHSLGEAEGRTYLALYTEQLCVLVACGG